MATEETSTTDARKTIAITGDALGPKNTHVETGTGEFVIGRDGSPLEYLLGSLAGCFNVIGHLVAKEQGITVDSLSVAVEGDIDTRRYMGESTEPRAGFETLRLSVTVETDADQAAVDAWIREVEARCPVADNLENGVGLSAEAIIA
ncbi:OsmC family protein [Haloarchaeobius baliensis]|uniref:OsmC family protein n=1 Tax=Haloarchaeobius baliensis TaxID=1670458 RepID=UPI003F882F8D